MGELTGNRAKLAAFRRGDRTLLTELYEQHYDAVYKVFRDGHVAGDARINGRHSIAEIEDLTQETFRRAFEDRGRHSYDGLRPFMPWLLQIARNLSVDVGRRSGREVLSDAIPEASDALPTPEKLAADAELRALVSQFHGELSAREQRIFEFRFVEGRSTLATARQAGLTRMQVRYTEGKLRTRMAALLLDSGYVTSSDAAGTVRLAALVSLFLVMPPEVWS